MNERRNDCDREVLLRGLLFSAVSRTLLLPQAYSRDLKYLVPDILIGVSSRSPQVRIGRQLSPTLGAVLIRVAERCGSFAPHKVRLQQIHTLSPHNYARTVGPALIRHAEANGRMEVVSPGISPQSGLP